MSPLNTAQLSADRLSQLLAKFSSCRLAILGDFFLDKYLDVDPALGEPSVETGKVAHQVVDVRCSPGAAGTVVCNLSALGATTLHAIGFTGDDGEGYELRRELRRLNCSDAQLHCIPQRRTPTYLKPRDAHAGDLSGEHSRYDTKNRQPTPASVQQLIIESLDRLLSDTDAVIVLDQVEQTDCGVVTAHVREAIANRAQRFPHVIFWGDSRRHVHDFRHIIVKPNQFETTREVNLPDHEVPLDILVAAAKQMRQANGAPIVVTRGVRGMLVSDPEWTVVPGVEVPGPIDPTGAGDSATAGTVLALCAGATLPEAAVIGNLVASITVQQISTTGVARPDQLLSRWELWHEQSQRHGQTANGKP